jgi:hypothetical protein
MELLMKRSEIRRGRYDLFAKLELEPEEEARIRKAAPEKNYVWEADARSNAFRWRLCLIPGGILAILFSILLGILTVPIFGGWLLIFGLPIAAVVWIPFTKLVFNQFRPGITIADLMTGRTIRCKSMDELYVKEEAIREHTKTYCGNIERGESWEDVQRHKLNTE